MLTPSGRACRLSFQSVSPKLRIRVTAEGKGSLLVDNAGDYPAQDYPAPAAGPLAAGSGELHHPGTVGGIGPGTGRQAIDGGLKLLSNDLKKYNISLSPTASAETALRILITSAYEIKDKGPNPTP